MTAMKPPVMKGMWVGAIVTLALSLASAANPLTNDYLTTVVVVYRSENIKTEHVRLHAKPQVHFPVLEDFFLEAHTLILEPASAEPTPFRVKQQSQSSFTIPNSGPHLDLLDWKHGKSDWVELEETSPNEFALAELTDPPLPHYTPAELEQAVMRKLKELGQDSGEQKAEWFKALKECQKEPGLCVHGSRRVLQIEAQMDGRWVPLSTVTIDKSLGC